MKLDHHGRRTIATSQARNPANLNTRLQRVPCFWCTHGWAAGRDTELTGHRLERLMTCSRAAQMTGHVATDLDRGRRGRHQPEVRKECDHLVQSMEWFTEPRRKGFE